MLFLIEGFNHVCSELINTNSAECSLEQARMCRCAHVWVLLYTFDVRERNWWGEKNRWLYVVYAALTREKYCVWGGVCMFDRLLLLLLKESCRRCSVRERVKGKERKRKIKGKKKDTTKIDWHANPAQLPTHSQNQNSKASFCVHVYVHMHPCMYLCLYTHQKLNNSAMQTTILSVETPHSGHSSSTKKDVKASSACT